jgi:hypothetical protein
MPSGGGNKFVPFVAITEKNLGNYLSIDEINGAIDKNPNYTESYLTNKINEIRKQFNTEDPTTIKSYLDAIISK